MKRMMVSMLLGFSLLLCSGVSAAKTDKELTYRTSQVWRSAVRFLRVDQHFKVLEKDKEAGYLLFEYENRGKKHIASMELVELVKNDKVLVRASLRIDAMPAYVESVLLDKFLRKMKDEYGDPPPARLVRKPSTEAVAQEDGKDAAAMPEGEEIDEDDLEITEDDLNENEKVEGND